MIILVRLCLRPRIGSHIILVQSCSMLIGSEGSALVEIQSLKSGSIRKPSICGILRFISRLSVAFNFFAVFSSAFDLPNSISWNTFFVAKFA